MTRTALLFSIAIATGIPSDAGAATVPASFAPTAAPGTQCAPLTWQSLYPWSHCHEWGHQVYGNGWGMPYFSIGFGGSGFAPIFPWGAYWGLDVRFLPVGWGHAHGPHLAGTGCAYRGDCVDRGVRPAKSFTIERAPTRTADDNGAVSSPAPALLFWSGAPGEYGVGRTAIAAGRPVSTAGGGTARVDNPPPPNRWAGPEGGDDPTRIVPPPGSSRSALVTSSPSPGIGDAKVVTLAPPTSRRLNSAQRTRPPSTTVHRVYSAAGATSLTSAQSRSRVRAIDRAVNQWRSRSSGGRTSVFGARSTRRGDYPARGGIRGSGSVRSPGTRGSAGASPTRGRKSTGEKGSTKVRTGGGGT